MKLICEEKQYSMKVTTLLFALIAFSSFFKCQPEQEQLTPYEMVSRAAAYVGDISSEDLEISIAVIVPQGINRGQSYFPRPPFKKYRIETRFEIDRPKGKEIAQFINPFNGFIFGGFHVLEAGKYTAYDNPSSTARAINTLGFENYRHFPHRYLNRALNDSANLVYNGVSAFRNGQAHLLTLSGNREMKLYLDSDSYAPLQVELQTVNHPYGDGVTVKKYYDYQSFGSLRFPTRFQAGGAYDSWGTLLNLYGIEEMTDPIALPDLDTFRPLRGDYAPAKMVSLAENLHMVQNVGNDKWGIIDYNVLIAEFEDHLLIGEAPVSNAASLRAIEMIRSHFPEKPIRYLVQSHHHSDHIAGIREYIAKEVTLVAPSATWDLLHKIAKASWELEPDAQELAPKELKLIPVKEPMTFSDDLNKAVILNIGPIPHVNDMLAIYFPKQQVVWQADMVTYGEWPLTIEPSVIFREKLKEYGWEVNKITGVHGQQLVDKALKDYLND